MAKVLINSAKNQPKSCYLFTTNQHDTQDIKDQFHLKWPKMYTEEILTTKHKNTFNGILCLNRYPENNINQTNQRDSRSTNTEWSYLKIPYISKRLNHKIANIFQRDCIPVCIAHRSYTLRRTFSYNTAEHTCTMEKCPISYTNLW